MYKFFGEKMKNTTFLYIRNIVYSLGRLLIIFNKNFSKYFSLPYQKQIIQDYAQKKMMSSWAAITRRKVVSG